MSTNIFESLGNAVKHWYVPLIVGLLMIGVGVWTFTSPMESYLALAIIFSVSFLVSGLMETYFSFANRKTLKNWGWSFALGFITLLVGFLLVRDPAITMVTLPFYVGFMLLFRSISSIGYAYDLKEMGVMDWGNLLVIGILGLLFSFFLLWNPAFAGMTIVIWTGLAFLFSGIYSVYLAIRLRKVHHKIQDIKDKI